MKKYIPQVSISEYDYVLPEDRIALYPTNQRNESKLLHFNRSEISHHQFSEISDLIPKNSFLLLNNTKVISARIKAQKESGGKAEILCIDPLIPSQDPMITMAAKGKCRWNCIIGGKRIKSGDILFPTNKNIRNFNAHINEKYGNEALVDFEWDHDITFAEVLSIIGDIPLPPYIKRETEESDRFRYQTVYATNDGSVAAPTAGLHFTEEILEKIRSNGTTLNEIILHVGPGTFKPIENDNIADHRMHAEQIVIHKEVIDNIIRFFSNDTRGKFIAVGTTSVRNIESLYWFGVKLINDLWNKEREMYVEQWDPYYLNESYELPSVVESLSAIIDLMQGEQLCSIRGYTELMIAPSYKFQLVEGLITNYHLPKSTLLLLVSALIGKENLFKIYDSALNNDYRFLSYCDSSFLLR